MRRKPERITAMHAPVITQNGASGIEGIHLTRSGRGFAVWQVNTSCKRNTSVVSHSGGRIQVHYLPEEGEEEYIAENWDYKTYLTEVSLALPKADKSDHWVVETVWDKYGGWIVAFLLPTLMEMGYSRKRLRIMRGGK